MFEKEAEEYLFDRLDPKAIDSVSEFSNKHIEEAIVSSFKDGAEFGYNKANEWHYVSKGEMPTDEETILIYLGARFVLGWYKFGFWYSNDGEIEEDVIAWKEIVLPKEID